MGYALFKAKNSKKFKDGFDFNDESPVELCSQYASPLLERSFSSENCPLHECELIQRYQRSRLKLKEFHKFDSAATALEQAAALVEGKVTPRLSTLLDSMKDEAKASLAVADPKLGMS